MDLDKLNPRMAGTRQRQVQDAQKMQQVVEDRLTKKGLAIPPYEFLELIGKGAYGRVYKSKNRENQQEYALKIIEVDQQDYHAGFEGKDETIKDFIQETSVLQTLKDNKARNVNIIFEAFAVDTQLWIISEYCPGGSLNTLMKACNPPGLGENSIIPIAREVAIALKYVHDAGILHRDIKCANILVTEDGRIQLCDFGISGVLENQVSKRTTIIGTPHWMAPELVTHIGTDFRGVSYGAEIDCWAFGCAVYEMATGQPPNARVPPQKLGVTLNIRAPRLDSSKHSQELCDFIAFCLEQQPESRPNATQIMEHPYIFDTSEEYPTSKLTQLIEDFAVWEQEGGQRSSLFNPMGAAGPEELESFGQDEDWNFSTTMDFDRRMSMRFDDNFNIEDAGAGGAFNFMEEQRSKRGGAALNRLFDQSAKPYAYGDGGRRGSDLPLRDYATETAGNRETLIDIGSLETPSFELLALMDPPTLRPSRNKMRDSDTESDDPPFQTARRATQDWEMNLSVDPPDDKKPRPPTMAWTFPPQMMPDSSDEQTPSGIEETVRRTDSTLKPNARTVKRSTMAWNFAEAQEAAATMPKHHASYTTGDATLEPPRPMLKHAATMPAGDSFSNNASPSPDRASMIDLDAALEISIPDFDGRPSTSHSATDSAVTDMTQGDPFDLEEQLELSKEASRTSLHMKSQSEPTTGFLEGKGAKEESNSLYGSDVELAAHNRSSSMNQSDRSDRERSTSRPPVGATARYRQRRPTALQRHLADRTRIPTSGDSTVASSRGGSFDSTGSTPAYGSSFSLGASDEDSKLWSQVKSRHRRQKTSDGTSTYASGASRSDSEGITMRAPARPSRLVGNWKPAIGPDGFVVPYEADKRILLPDPPEDVAIREFSRLWHNLQSMNSQNAEMLEKEYGIGGPVNDADIDAELEAEFGPKSTWAANAAAMNAGSNPGSSFDEDTFRFSETSTLRGSSVDQK